MLHELPPEVLRALALELDPADCVRLRRCCTHLWDNVQIALNDDDQYFLNELNAGRTARLDAIVTDNVRWFVAMDQLGRSSEMDWFILAAKFDAVQCADYIWCKYAFQTSVPLKELWQSLHSEKKAILFCELFCMRIFGMSYAEKLREPPGWLARMRRRYVRE